MNESMFRFCAIPFFIATFLMTSFAFAKGPKIRVAIDEVPLEVVSVPLEQYLLGVLTKEMPSQWPIEALKAQAVAARSYAYYHVLHPRSSAYDVRATVSDQVYAAQKSYEKNIHRAVKKSHAEILVWKGATLPAFFHSCCGGESEQADHVWDWAQSYQFYQIKKDPYCSECPSLNWEYVIAKDALSLLLIQEGLITDSLEHLVPQSFDDSQRVRTLTLVTKAKQISITAENLRKVLGYQHLKSTAFGLLEMEEDMIFVGMGSGHGVGLCQWGARGMAYQGLDYRDILNFYYPGVEIKKMNW